MMTGTLILAASLLAVSAMLCFTLSRAWQGWLELKRLELAARAPSPSDDDGGDDEIGVRIELAAVRERLKKLEAIASGVEL